MYKRHSAHSDYPPVAEGIIDPPEAQALLAERRMSPNSVTTSGGVSVRIPDGWEGQVARNGKGLVFQAPGAEGDANTIRIMDPNVLNPKGYVVYTNDLGPRLDVFGNAGNSLGMKATHIPWDFIGPLPKWPQ